MNIEETPGEQPIVVEPIPESIPAAPETVPDPVTVPEPEKVPV